MRNETGLLKLNMQYFAEDSDNFEDNISDYEFEDDMFDDEDNEDIENSDKSLDNSQENESEAEKQNVGNNTENLSAVDTYEVKYNGATMSMTLNDLITNAQKGLNYDKVLNERDTLRQSREIAVMNELAKANGMTTEQLCDAIERAQQERAIQSQVNSGIPRELAQKMIDYENTTQRLLAAEKAREQQEAQRQEYMNFIRAYPDVDTLPNEVIEQVKKGVPLIQAYATYENTMLKQKIAALEQNNTNIKKAVGSLGSDISEEQEDSFMAAFNSEF